MGLHSDRRILLALVLPIIVINAISLGSNAILPALLARSPLLLIAMNARNTNLVLTAAAVDVVPFVALAVTRRLIEDPFYYLLGRRYGDRAIQWLDRRGGGRGFASRLVNSRFRFAIYPMLFISPGGLVCVAAGAIGMRVKTFLVLNIAGAFAFVIALRVFGIALAVPVTALRVFFDRNIVWTTALAAVLVVLYVVVHKGWQRRSSRPPGSSLFDLAEPDASADAEADRASSRATSVIDPNVEQKDAEPCDNPVEADGNGSAHPASPSGWTSQRGREGHDDSFPS